MLWRLLLCVCALVAAQRVERIDGINIFQESALSGARQVVVGTPPAGLDEVPQFPVLPLSTRTIYRPYVDEREVNPATTHPVFIADPLVDVLIVEGQNLNLLGPGDVFLVPFADVVANPGNPCASANSEPLNEALAVRNDIASGELFLSSPTKAGYYLPLNRLSLFPQDGAFICVNQAGGVLFTNILYQVTPACDQDASFSSVAPVIGFENATLGTAFRFPTDCSRNPVFDLNLQPGLAALLGEDLTNVVRDERQAPLVRVLDRVRRTVCCGVRDQVTIDGQVFPKRFGQCINPTVQSCCSSATDNRLVGNNLGGIGKPYSPFREQCCFGGDLPPAATVITAARTTGQAVAIRDLDDFCPCRILDAADATVLPSPALANDYCGANQRCCDAFRFSELQTPGARVGKCFDPQREGCCDTGDIFDKGSQQCCAINGVQSLDFPCPCATDADCRLPQVPFLQGTKRCCRQTAPAVNTIPDAVCSPYLNFPTGSGTPELQSCPGVCIDINFQICCNGVTCMNEYERCCNATCCNRFSSQCEIAWKAGSPRNPFNTRDYRVPFETCTRIESLTPHRAAIVYYLPAALLVATYLGLAFSLFFAKRVNALNPLSGYEYAVFAFALLVVLFSWPLYFSPLYKYGVVFVWVAFLAIVASLSGVRFLMPLAIFAEVILLLYFFDWFYGNSIASFAYVRPDRVVGFNGIWHSLENMWDAPLDGTVYDYNQIPVYPLDRTVFPGFRCIGFYDGFFLRDPTIEDQDRWDNPYKYTFGLCARGWIATLLVLQALNCIFIVLLFIATVIAQLKNILVKKVLERTEVAAVPVGIVA